MSALLIKPLSYRHGFTVVEIMVVISVLGILIVLVIGTMSDFYQSSINTATQSTQSSDTRGVLRSIENSVASSSAFLMTTEMAMATPLGWDDATADWTYKGVDTLKPNNRVLITRNYATDKPPSDASRGLSFVGGCDASTGTPAINNTIYFVKRDPTSGLYNLYRRVIHPPGTLCPVSAQKQTCSANKVNAYPSVCDAGDAILLYNVENFTVDYYATATASTPIVDEYGAGDISGARSVNIAVSTRRVVNGNSQLFTSSLRISRINP